MVKTKILTCDSFLKDLCSDSKIQRVLWMLCGSTFVILATFPRKKKEVWAEIEGGKAVRFTRREHREGRDNEQMHKCQKLLDNCEESEVGWSPGDKDV